MMLGAVGPAWLPHAWIVGRRALYGASEMLDFAGAVSIRSTQHLEIRREGGEKSAGEKQWV
jgi:hypothetical protein